MNPSPYKNEHALTLNGRVATSSLNAVRNTAEDFYRLSRNQADTIEKEITDIVKTWRVRAEALSIPRPEIQLMASVFLV
jgi:hypothetical protein